MVQTIRSPVKPQIGSKLAQMALLTSHSLAEKPLDGS